MAHRDGVGGFVDDLDRGEDRRVEPLEQAARERHAHARARGRAARRPRRDPRRSASRRARACPRRSPASPTRRASRSARRRSSASIPRKESSSGNHRERQRSASASPASAIGVDHARELGLHRLGDDARVQRTHRARSDDRDPDRSDLHGRAVRASGTERVAHRVDDAVEVGVGEVRVDRAARAPRVPSPGPAGTSLATTLGCSR